VEIPEPLTTSLRFRLTTTKNYYNPTQSYRLNKSAGGQCIPELGGQHHRNIQIEQGKRDIAFTTLCSLAKYFEVDLNSFT